MMFVVSRSYLTPRFIPLRFGLSFKVSRLMLLSYRFGAWNVVTREWFVQFMYLSNFFIGAMLVLEGDDNWMQVFVTSKFLFATCIV